MWLITTMVMCTFGTGESNNIKLLALQAGTTPSVSGYSKDAHPNHHQHILTCLAEQISVPQLIKAIINSFKGFCQDPFMKLTLWTPHDPYWINTQDLTLEATLHNISINPSSIDGPADGEIFISNHLAEIPDIQSKHIQNLVKMGETYCHLCVQLLNPSPKELENLSGQLWERLWQPICTTSYT